LKQRSLQRNGSGKQGVVYFALTFRPQSVMSDKFLYVPGLPIIDSSVCQRDEADPIAVPIRLEGGLNSFGRTNNHPPHFVHAPKICILRRDQYVFPLFLKTDKTRARLSGVGLRTNAAQIRALGLMSTLRRAH
jgi:hypothetical protein